MTFNGFISYSHAADGRLAPAVQRGLHRLAKPWHRRRALWIFRDQTGLSVTPALWSSIQDALDASDYFVLLASPEAARSLWVNREIEHWVATKSADRILPVVTDGQWRWDPVRRDFAEDSTAVPAALRGVFSEEPLFLDLRWARDDQHLSLRHSRFRNAIAQLAAPMHGVSRDDLEGEDVRQHRRAQRLRSTAVTTLVLFALAALTASALAVRYAGRATAAANEARRQQQVAVQQHGSAQRSAAEARRQQDLARQQQALAHDAAAETRRQEQLARDQKAAAEQASGDARRQQQYALLQQGLADRAATHARDEEQLAQRQRALAQQWADEARQQEQAAQDQERLAQEAAQEARQQQQEADRQKRIAVGRRLINQAETTIGDDPKTALTLGIAAQRIDPEAGTRRDAASLVTSTRHAGAIDDVTAVAYGPGGLLATVDKNGSVSLWNVTDRANPVRRATVGNPGPLNNSLALSRDGRTLAVVRDGTAVLWDVADPSHPVQTATLPDDRYYYSAAFSPDGHTLATGDRTSADGYATLWDVTDRTRPAQLSTLNGGDLFAGDYFGFSADGRTLVVMHGAAVVWDITDRANPVERSEIGVAGTIYSAALSPTAPILAIGNSLGAVYLYDLTDVDHPKYDAILTSNTGILRSLGFSSDGRTLASGDTDGTAILWELDGYYPREISRVSGHDSVESLGFSRDGRTLATANSAATAVLWNVTGFAAPQRLVDLAAHDGSVLALAYGHNGRTMTTVGGDGTATFWDLTDRSKPARRTTVPLHGGAEITSAAISTDGRTVAAGGWDAVATLTDVTDPARPSTLATIDPEVSWLGGLTFSPDGRTLAISGGGKIQLWDLTDRRRPKRIAAIPSTSGSPAAFSPDGRTMAVNGTQEVSLWDLTDRAVPTQLSTLVSGGNSVVTVAFSPDGKTLATGSAQRIATLWDVTSRTRPYRLATLTGQAYQVSSLTFSADGGTLATGGNDGWAMVWDIAELAKPVRLATVELDHYANAGAMTFSPEGGTLAIGTSVGYGTGSGHLGLWDLTALNSLRADPAKLACVVAGRGLTADEWARYIPELPYQRTCPG